MLQFRSLLAGCAWLLLVISAGRADDSTAQGWIELIDGPALDAWQSERSGWTIVGDAKQDAKQPRRLVTQPGEGVLVSDGDGVNFHTKQPFKDVQLECEFMIPERSNAGVKLNGLYEIQIRDTAAMKELTGDMCGGVYPRAKLGPPYAHIDEGIAPSENAAKSAGEWQTLTLTFYSPRFDAAGKKVTNARFENVVLNGKQVHEQVDLKHPTGAAWNLEPEVAEGGLMLQGDHGPVAFRKIRVKELGGKR
ncbi:3-keto-disaccharide hydrolase [Lacipirellula parvula]|uniref:3-keto-alpha-glucoside-1,2-lyase/3-keto-2-hydroxy-glucal hydratase domain-containing protein n=1 Tax=Lacipirellula parvula TaxID=2650471 RepID=A0A5K7XFW6_9BACT|nr:DUF1080 domain-containing protein [Lacipirellula parvula]BBO35744.1 hypothetical protein PLANPX_5356 [Lacipirellula parvula]